MTTARVPYSYVRHYESAVPLADDIGTLSTYGPVVAREDPRLRQLLADAPAISLHDHPIRYPDPLTYESWALFRGDNRVALGYEGILASGVAATIANINTWHTAHEAIELLARLRADAVREPRVQIVDRLSDFFDPDGKRLTDAIGVILSLETLTPFAENASYIETLFGLGVRVSGLIYSEGSTLGAGLGSAHDQGLTSQGSAFVDAMDDVGMVIDLSHVGDQTSLDVIERSINPVLISHAGSRQLWDTSRMKPTAVLRALADRGGVIGVEAAPNTTLSPGRGTHDIEAVVDHVDALVQEIGVDHVGLGPDLIYGKHAELHEVRSLGSGGANAVTFVNGVENPTEAFWNIASCLVERGYPDEEIRKILGGNAFRLLKSVLPA